MTDVLRYAAFTDRPEGGNPAGVVLDAAALDDAEMLAIAADLGYSESAFLPGRRRRHPLLQPARRGPVLRPRHDRDRRWRWPTATVPASSCSTRPRARCRSTTQRDGDGRIAATLTSVPPQVVDLDPARPRRGPRGAGLGRGDLDPALPPRVAYAGVWHPVIAAATRERLADLDYDFDRLGALMAARRWTTVQLVWREHDTHFHARDPFPPGGIVEDPATGAAAAALGAYLRELGLVALPATVTIVQGEDMGRRSLLTVDITERPEIDVTGTAVVI